MKKAIILMIWILLLGINLPAEAGDFIVEGNVGIGTETPAGKVDITGTNVTAIKASPTKTNTSFLTGMKITAIDSYSGSSASGSSRGLTVTADHTGTPTGSYSGIEGANYQLRFYGSGNVSQAFAQQNTMGFNSNNNYNVTNLYGNLVQLSTGGAYTGTHTITNYYGFYSLGASTSQTLNGTNWRHAYFADFPDYGGTVTNVTGLWIDKQTLGTNKYGVVLNGDGAGADLVLGSNKETKLYGSSGNLIVNTAGNMGIGTGTTTPTEKLEVNGGVKLNTAAAKPGCNSVSRGTLWFTQSSSGLKDILEICAKDASDVYMWRILY